MTDFMTKLYPWHATLPLKFIVGALFLVERTEVGAVFIHTASEGSNQNL